MPQLVLLDRETQARVVVVGHRHLVRAVVVVIRLYHDRLTAILIVVPI